jgi:serine/threonine protein phosphatase PrpC
MVIVPESGGSQVIDSNASHRWFVFGCSVPGASHKRAGKPNQDYHLIETHGSGQSVVVAVADGHGSRKSFRSDRGSKFAAEVAVELLRCYIPSPLNNTGSTYNIQKDTEVDLPQRIVRLWQQRVDEDLAGEKLSEIELSPLLETERAKIRDDSRAAYGTTLIAALLLPDCAVYLQLGDGDVLVVNASDTEAFRPLPADGRSFANETASLASPAPVQSAKRPNGGNAAWADFRVRIVPITVESPALVLLTTDGYVNAFVNDAAFQKAATDILAIGRSEGWEFVQRNLPGWLEEASRHGSGDDVTVVVVARCPEVVGGKPGAFSPLATGEEQGPKEIAQPIAEPDQPGTPETPPPEKI